MFLFLWHVNSFEVIFFLEVRELHILYIFTFSYHISYYYLILIICKQINLTYRWDPNRYYQLGLRVILLCGWENNITLVPGEKTFFPGNTCLAGLSLLLSAWGTPKKECRHNQVFFVMAAHEFQFLCSFLNKMTVSNLTWWEVG